MRFLISEFFNLLFSMLKVPGFFLPYRVGYCYPTSSNGMSFVGWEVFLIGKRQLPAPQHPTFKIAMLVIIKPAIPNKGSFVMIACVIIITPINRRRTLKNVQFEGKACFIYLILLWLH